jgi:hypothetical protein
MLSAGLCYEFAVCNALYVLRSFKFFARRANLLVEPRITLMARMGIALFIREIRAIRGLISRMLAREMFGLHDTR